MINTTPESEMKKLQRYSDEVPDKLTMVEELKVRALLHAVYGNVDNDNITVKELRQSLNTIFGKRGHGER